MPAWILWLSPVIIATLLAVAWITWAARPKKPEEAREGVQQYDKFRAALTDPAHENKPSDKPIDKPGGNPSDKQDGRVRGDHRSRRRAS